MRLWLISLVLLTGLPGGGRLLEAYRYYETGQFDRSAETYLLSLRENPELASEIRFNVAQAYMRMDSLERALMLFEQLDNSRQGDLAASASNNAGIILVQMGRYPEALEAFRRALIFDETHEIARFNFELLSKRLRQDAPPPPLPQEDKPDESNLLPPDMDEQALQQILKQLQDRSSSVDEDKGRPLMPGDTLNREAALRILRALSDQDVQYVQQLRRVYIQPNRPRQSRGW